MNLSDYLPSLSPEQGQKLNQVADLILAWNNKLTRSVIRDRDGVLLKHLVDALLILPSALIQPAQKVLDMGPGGGFPGLALAIDSAQTAFTLVDATEKKIPAAEARANSLRLQNVRC